MNHGEDPQLAAPPQPIAPRHQHPVIPTGNTPQASRKALTLHVVIDILAAREARGARVVAFDNVRGLYVRSHA